MARSYYKPGPPLGWFVDTFWLYQDEPPQPHKRERLLPDGSVELVINLRAEGFEVQDRVFTDSVICGPHSRYFMLGTSQQTSVLGVHFLPGGAFPFFGVPACELRNQHVSLEDLVGAAASDRVRNELLQAAGSTAKFKALEAFLWDRARGKFTRHPAVDYALRQFQCAPRMTTIAQVSASVGLSAKRFIHTFEQEVGLTPKRFCRVRRFQGVLRRIQASGRVEWAQVAADCGYFDQAHFIHDFQSFSGMNPSNYLRLRTGHVNHVAVPEAG